MSSLGFEVVGVDTDQHKVDLLSRGELPFYEPGLDTLLAAEMKTGRLSFTTDFSAVADADVHFICVGTPQSKDGLAADLTYVKSSVAAIAPHLKDGALVVGKSTVPVGTAQSLRDILATSAPQADLAWNPEFLREGFAVEDTLTPNRLVVGVVNDRAEEILKEVYKPIIDLGTPWIRADLPTAELVKVAANSFLQRRFHLSTLWQKFVRQLAGMSLCLQRRSVTTHELEIVSYRQVLVLEAVAFQKISVPLWRARKNLALTKRSNSYARLMPLTYVHANA
jgi:nucleotide sugar dehydrogenase